MSDLTQLKTAIVARAENDGQVKLRNAKLQHEEEYEAKKLIQEREFEAKKQRSLEAAKRHFQREEQKLLNQERNALLTSKQAVLTTLFEEAVATMNQWDTAKQLEFIQSVLRSYSAQDLTIQFGQLTRDKLADTDLEAIKQLNPNISFKEECIAHQGGFIISRANVDDNYLFSDLIEAEKETQNYVIAAQIFDQN